MANPKIVGSLVKTLLPTNFEEIEEPYILTPEEEEKVIRNAIEREKEQMEWKMKSLSFHAEQIAQKIRETDWESKIDRALLLKTSNSNKHYDLWQKEQREKEKAAEDLRRKELVETWTAENVFRLMKWASQHEYGKPLIVNEHNRKLISALCFFVSEDERFETELGFSFKKGLLIRGISGLGKTHLVQCIQKNELNPVLILSMIEIADTMKHEGEYQINLGNKKVIYLDDVGTEEATVNHYGTKINFFKNFIEMVYLRNEGKSFNKLMMSTNNSFDEIEEKYGFRVRSRMRDMFNVLEVSGTDMRQ